MELSTRYEPATSEPEIYAKWKASGGFEPRPSEKGTFTVAIPPPNVTGVLHMGHALNGTIQDIVVRHRRMLGYETLWIPGTDHAGIATQAVVEKKLAKEGKKREEIGREAFLEEVWSWKEEHGDKILAQFQSLGCSADWSRTAFTLDPNLSHAVRVSFTRLFDKGLVYRGMRLVNWDCELQTAVSDDEIEHVPRKTKLWHLRYPVKGEPGRFMVVATTRPETMVGDTGVAVHPDDERYRDLVGKFCILPFIEREIPIIADESVDPKFGTGAVKVTPGHDPADYERGARHKLPIISVLEKDGKLNEHGGPFAGMSREKARKEIVARLEEADLIEKIEEHQHNLALSDRSKTPIEPMISEQWFVKMRPLAEPAIKAIDTGALKFRPERWTKVYLQWLEKVHDWCISRQLWWGHRIPVWYDEDDVPVASIEDLELGSAHPKTGKPIVRQDPDVLDTWASSWLWPFATLGWPEKSADVQRYYPTQFLSTARDIIYLWVARMVMAGYEFMDDRPEEERCPFATCYVHATVLDGQGRRMSKSLGNGIDPLDMIAKYGADAVRFSLILLTKEGQDVKLSTDKFEQGMRFQNKIWNAARFILMNMSGARRDVSEILKDPAARMEDRWILSRLERTRSDVSCALEEYRFNDAGMLLYRFVWDELCDWYLEICKARLTTEDDPTGPDARGTLARVLQDTVGLLHPFTPHMTEVLWKHLHEVLGTECELLMLSSWPDGEGLACDEVAEAEITTVQNVVHAVRQVRSLTLVKDREPLAALVVVPDDNERAVLERHAATVQGLACLGSYEVTDKAERPPSSAVAVAGRIEAFVSLGPDVDLAELKSVLERRKEKLAKGIEGGEKKLSNERFVSNADPEIVEGERTRKQEMAVELELLERNLGGL